MPDITLETFKSTLKDGIRPNRFWITFSPPVGGKGDKLTFLVKSASVPGVTIGEIGINWQGMTTYVAGDPEFSTWDVTFIQDYENVARTIIENWLNLIVEVTRNVSNVREEPINYKRDIEVEQLGRSGETLAKYKLIGAFPTNLNPVDLNMDTTNTIADFSVTFRFDYWIREE